MYFAKIAILSLFCGGVAWYMIARWFKLKHKKKVSEIHANQLKELDEEVRDTVPQWDVSTKKQDQPKSTEVSIVALNTNIQPVQQYARKQANPKVKTSVSINDNTYYGESPSKPSSYRSGSSSWSSDSSSSSDSWSSSSDSSSSSSCD